MQLVKGTEVYHVLESTKEYRAGIKRGAEILFKGGLVVFPTETVYGLGAHGLKSSAIDKIFVVKGRPSDNPLILHLHSVEQVEELVEEIPKAASLLMERFWPGPLTLVLKRRPLVPHAVTAGLSTVALRIPNSSIALDLIKASQVPLAAPSANLSGRPSPTSPAHVLGDLAGRIPLLLDGGETGIGLESTVLDMTREPPLLLRPGGITLEDLLSLLGDVQIEEGVTSTTPREPGVVASPGMKYRHYAPKTPMILVEEGEGDVDALSQVLLEKALEATKEGQRVGLLVTRELAPLFREKDLRVYEMGSRDDLSSIGHYLFALLREMDGDSLHLILAQGLPEKGLGLAIMNRLRRSAGYRIIKV